MASGDLETLREADEAHTKANEAVDERWRNLAEALSSEADAIEKRIDTYTAVLLSGFVIERVLDPKAIKFLAGWRTRYAHIFDHGEDESVWLELDEDHAAGLSGQFFNFVEADIYPRHRSVDDLKVREERRSKQELKVAFQAEGRRENADMPDNLRLRTYEYSHEGEGVESATAYNGLLRAIEWRLPTQEEIQRFGSDTANLYAKNRLLSA